MRAWTKREVLAYLDRVIPILDSSDHFELLDVSPSANSHTIQGAFHTMAAGLHPDRHRNALAAAEHEKLIVVYARIAEAYRVLRDPKHREKYLREMARQQKKNIANGEVASTAAVQSPEAALALLSPKAQQLYRRGMAALRTGDLSSAKLNLRMALAKHPQSGFLKAALRSLKKSV